MIPTLFYYLTLPSLLFALNPIEIKGSKFFDSVTGDQFFMKGVAYQPRAGGNYDPLADVAGCKRDIPHLKALGTNTIRVYETYSNKSHDECMKLLDEAGIYVLLDLPTPDVSINRNQPAYDTTVYNFYKQKIDVFSKYNNVLGFFAGNEVNNDKTNTPSSAHVKA
ncbi:glycolipid anchored surface protein GAS1, partial [Neoconidiobolus thromboides FSU 785]